MATLITNQTDFSLNFAPLIVSPSLEIVEKNSTDSDGSYVRQDYDVIGGGYYPDYTLWPLVLQPRIYVSDPDGQMGDGLIDVTKDITNMKWYAIERVMVEGVETTTKTLLQSGEDYVITADGANKGRLKFKRNVSVDNPVTLVFEAEYLDTRTGDVHPILMTQLVRADAVTKSCELSLDVPSQIFYNPLERDSLGNKVSVLKVNASIFSGDTKADPSKCKCIWKLCADDGVNWYDFDNDPSRLFGEVSDDTMSININMEMMGKEIVVKCFGLTSDDPSVLASMTEDNAFDNVQFKITRKLPLFNASIQRMPRTVDATQTELNPKLQIDFNSFQSDNPEEEIDTVWYSAPANVNFNENHLVAKGLQPTIKADIATPTTPQKVKVEIRDRGEWKIAKAGNKVLTDGSGKIIMIR